MPRCLISLGANLGDTLESMRAAGRLLREIFGEANIRASRLYRTPPIGGPTEQSDFLNAVVSIETAQSCWQVWESIKSIERSLGRERLHRWEARRIDLDILLFDDLRLWTPHLKIPHPRMCMRSFVLLPAAEIAASWLDPVSGWTLQRLADNLDPESDRPLVVLANRSELRAWLETQWRQRSGSATGGWIPVQFIHANDPEDGWARFSEHWPRLAVVCVETPEPESIQWEDFSRPWAASMRLTDLDPRNAWEGPRYLLPANDRAWAMHEIESALSAMTCSIHPTDQSLLL